MNIQQIYKTFNGSGNQSYTLGLNNISSTDIGKNHNNLITITEDRILVKASLHKTKTNRNASNNTLKSTGFDSTGSNDTADSIEYFSMTDFDVDKSEEVTTNDERTTNGRIVESTFQPIDILAAEIVDDAVSLDGRIDSKTSVNELDESETHAAENAFEELQDYDYNEGDEHKQNEMLDDDMDVVEETVETIETTDTIDKVPSPSKYPMNHLNGGKFVLLNGTNQLKNIKYKKFALTDKPNGAENFHNTNGTNTTIHANGDKSRVDRPTPPIDLNKVAICIGNGKPKRTIHILNGKSRVLEETHRNGFIIKRFSMNGLGENLKLRRLKVVRVNEKSATPLANSSTDDERDVDVMGEDEIANEQQRSAADLISQLEG